MKFEIFLSSVFNKAIIPLTLIGYELMVVDSVPAPRPLSKNSYPTCIHGIIVKYSTM